MAGVTKVNGKYHTEEMVSRDLFFKAVTPASTSQEDFDEAMQEVALTSTIEVIGTYISDEDVLAALPDVIVATATVNVVISGADVLNGVGEAAGDLATGGTIADIAGF